MSKSRIIETICPKCGKTQEFEGDYLGFGNYIFLRKGALFDYYKRHTKDLDVGDKYTNWDNIVENYYKEDKSC